MNGEYIIDSYLDWYFSDDYIWDDVNKEYVYNDTNESEVKNFKSLQDVKEYITKTIAKHSKDFVTQNYSVEYSNRQRSALATTHTRYLRGNPICIRFVFNNKYLASYETNEDAIKDTVLHEIAHAIVGNHHHHDYAWKSCCRKIGCQPSRFKSVTY